MMLKYRRRFEAFVRTRTFGIGARDVFPEDSAAGKKFLLLAEVVKTIQEQLVRQTQARAEARRVKAGTRKSAREFMKAMASAGRRVTVDETGPNPFRLPTRRSAEVTLASARLFMEEAERRKAQFADFGLPPAFFADFAAAVDALAAAVARQRESRASRHKAKGALNAAFDRGMRILADLDVVVSASLRGDPARLAEWMGARQIEQPGDAPHNPADSTPDTADPPPSPSAPPATGAAGEVTATPAESAKDAA